MIAVERQALVPYSAASMYALVADVERYPEFLPWCSGTEVLVREQKRTLATIDIDFWGVRQQFTTENRNEPGKRIDLALVSGPFRSLGGAWRFTPLGDGACKVELSLAYEIANPVLDRLIGPVFHYIANTVVDAFVRRADAVHAK